MKKYLLPCVLGSLLLGACSQPAGHLSEGDIQNKIDSAYAARLDELNTEMMEDLDRRAPIEVPRKADSIVQARLSGAR